MSKNLNDDPEYRRLVKALEQELLKMEGLIPRTKPYEAQLKKCEAADAALKKYIRRQSLCCSRTCAASSAAIPR